MAGGMAIQPYYYELVPAHIDTVERRRQLLDVAWQVALVEGLGAATVRRVASGAGLSASAVQRAFPTQAALHRFLAGEVVRRNRADLFAAHDQSPADKIVAALPVDAVRRETLMLANQMRQSRFVFAEYPVAAAQVRSHLLSFCEHQFRVSAGLAPTAPLKGTTAMAMMRLQIIFDGLTSALLDDPLLRREPPSLTSVRSLVLQALPSPRP